MCWAGLATEWLRGRVYDTDESGKDENVVCELLHSGKRATGCKAPLGRDSTQACQAACHCGAKTVPTHVLCASSVGPRYF